MTTRLCQKIATKNWYEKNKDAYYEVWNEASYCICGGKFTLRNKSTHYKTMKHLEYEIVQELKKCL